MVVCKFDVADVGSPQPLFLVDVVVCKFDVADVGSPQLLFLVDLIVCKSDVADVGSPQPPPGGGLLLMVAGPSARLRACLAAGIDLARGRRAAAWGGGGPQFVAELARTPQAAARKQEIHAIHFE